MNRNTPLKLWENGRNEILAGIVTSRTRAELPAFAFPGGYPMEYLTRDNSVICADCATDAIFEYMTDYTAWALGQAIDPWNDESICMPVAEDYTNFPVAFDIYYEGPDEQCEECGKVIESAYGDPDAQEENG